MSTAIQKGQHVATNTQLPGSEYDPWDAPFFGAPVYLSYPVYRAAAPDVMKSADGSGTQAESARALDADPRADLTPAVRQVTRDHQVTREHAEPAIPPAGTAQRRGWLARLFGAR